MKKISNAYKSAVSYKSAVYKGYVRHRRFEPIKHEFNYSIYMLYLDLDEISGLFGKHWFSSFNKRNLVSWMRKDFYQPNEGNLKQVIIKNVYDYANQQGVTMPSIARVAMLTHVRYFNIIFNPVTFYYCFDEHDNLLAILSEITNTPWKERHTYVLLTSSTSDKSYENKGDKYHSLEFKKKFHVSPFNPMNMNYHWTLSEPDERINIHMENMLISESSPNKHFDATLILDRLDWHAGFTKSLIQYPFITVKVIWGIYWQALKLWIKKAPFYNHPDKLEKPLPDSK
ncbi:DUF1365 domain-containing protein [Oceaniserpentilla sp. 4NH20-0058]|uniref:DUF1365 domain-containing protein n=1 Tax=Oceaniserpentilla sp. 4NH20-0058 TaxID=3127660 RepID=UPI0031022538